MTENNTRIIHMDNLPQGGFAGIVEKHLVQNPQIWREAAFRSDISKGIGDFIYTAIGHFNPNDGAPLHPHRDVDIVTLISSGEIGHEGTNGGGTIIKAPGAQVQRAGTGMTHSEFSTKPEKADFVQMWFLPPQSGLKPGYQNHDIPEDGKLHTVLGGKGDTFDNNITCQIGYLNRSDRVNYNKECIVIIFDGKGVVNGHEVKRGDLIETTNTDIKSTNRLGLILISKTHD